ncbi:MAG: hypothetical protein LBQ24_00330 [Candidatus Peribacteria bacterium]|nr:hypothetical protein [Candidatus Peribacteria bacterium]
MFNSVKSSIISSQVFVSKAPVGSSAKIIQGFTAKALAIETLCCCHQLSSFGLLSILSDNQTFFSASIALFFLSVFGTQA